MTSGPEPERETAEQDVRTREETKPRPTATSADPAGPPGRADATAGRAGTNPGRAGTNPGRAGTNPGRAGGIPRGRLARLCQKELRETIRDRRTIVTLVLMPLLVYPLLSMALNRYILSSAASPTAGYSIGVATEREGAELERWLSDPRSQPPDAVRAASGGGLAEFRFFVTGDVTPRQAVERNDIDVGAALEPGSRPGSLRVRLIAYQGDSASEAARRIVVQRLQWLRLAEAEARATAADPSFASPVDIEVETVGEARSRSLLGTIVPLVLVLMTITGAVYPAIDLTAGERERGTMEPLMASPVSRTSLLLAKYTAVVVVALLTAMANLLAMFVTLWASGLMEQVTGEGAGVPWIALLQILALLVLFSGFFSAVLLSLTSFAKSFKEAQAYLIPVMLLALGPAMVSLMPGVRLAGPLAIAPLLNIVLLARDVLSGTVESASAVAAVVSTLAYAAAALGVAAHLFGSDAVTRTSDQSIGSLFRRPPIASPVPTPQAAALMLALLVPVYFVVSNGLMRFLSANRESVSLGGQLLLNAAALTFTFGLVPLFAAYLGRNRLATTFRVGRPGVGGFVGAAMIGLGAWAVAHEAFVIADAAGIGGLSEERIRETLKVVENWKQVSPWLLVGTLALVPAVIEELCFRGYLFSSLLRVLSPPRTILVTSALFGLFHVLTGNALLIERFIPTTLLGLMLGWVAWRTGSVLPGMVMHLFHNGLLELVARYHESLAFLGEDLEQQSHLPAIWLIGATAIAVTGALVVFLTTRRRLQPVEPAR